MIAAAGECGKRGQGVERDVHAERARGVAPVSDAGEERFRQSLRRDQAGVEQFWIDARGDISGADGFAVIENDAGRAMFLDDHLADAAACLDVSAMLARGIRYRLADRAHATDGMTPDALLAV